MGSTALDEKSAAKSRKRAPNAEPKPPEKLPVESRTDPTRWRMKDDDSRHTWHYLSDKQAAEDWPQSLAERYYLSLPLVRDDRAPGVSRDSKADCE